MKRNLLSENTWVSIHRGCDARGLHAEIYVGIECLPLAGVIYNHFKRLALNEDESVKIKGLIDKWQDDRYKTRLIKVYPKEGVKFYDWYLTIVQAVRNAITNEINSKINN